MLLLDNARATTVVVVVVVVVMVVVIIVDTVAMGEWAGTVWVVAN